MRFGRMAIDRSVAGGIAANAWTALVQVVFIPVYIAVLGAEAYGLIGFYAALQVALALLDLGMTPTLNREAGLAIAGSRAMSATRDLLRSTEWMLLVVAGTLASAMWWLAPWIAGRWLGIEHLDSGGAVDALRLIGALLAVRLFVGPHRGVIAGAQAFAWLNGVNATFATLRGAAVIPVLWWSPSIEAFFTHQLVVSAIEAFLVRAKAWSLLPGTGSATWARASLDAVDGFRGGVTLATAASLVATQADKLVVSSMLPLAHFGYYALASAVASALALLSAPVGMVAYSRLTDHAGRGDDAGAVRTFRGTSRLLALLVAPAAGVLAAFAYPLLLLWTKDAEVSRQAAGPLAVLALGSMLNASLQIPFLQALSRGRSRSAAVFAWALVVLYVPVLAWSVVSHGAIAAAWAWFGLNLVAVLMVAILPLPGIPPGVRLRWLLFDVGTPSGVAAAAFLIARA